MVQLLLHNRKEYVCIKGSKSVLSTIEAGVLQSSVLEPLLCLIYINNLHRSSSLLSHIHYADDMTGFVLSHCYPIVLMNLVS